MTRRVVVNADDFGRTDGITRGILHAHAHGIVTSASLMVRWPAAAPAAEAASSRSRLGVGLHLDLGEWGLRDGEWVALYEVGGDPAVEAERQLETFRRLVGADPTHLDSHQHVHRCEPVASALAAVADRLGVPLRGREVPYRGDFYGQGRRGEPLPELIGVDALVALLAAAPPGASELGCHPGFGDGGLESGYAAEREREVETLCDARVAAAVAALDIELVSFADLGWSAR